MAGIFSLLRLRTAIRPVGGSPARERITNHPCGGACATNVALVRGGERVFVSTLPRYHQIAADLRRRRTAGKFAVGSKLPGISDLQEEYQVRGLHAVRQAQRVADRRGLDRGGAITWAEQGR
jgi:hypothetical protein